jgi:hypothetical protein
LLINGWSLFRGYFGFFFGDYLTNLPGTLSAYLPSHPGRAALSVAMILTIIASLYVVVRGTVRLARGDHFLSQVVRLLAGMVALFTLVFMVIDVSSPAHLIFIFIPLFLLMVLCWDALQGRLKIIVAIVMTGLTLVSVADYYSLHTFACERADWRAAGRFLGGELKESDGVLFTRARDAYYVLKFYLPDLEEGVYYIRRHDPIGVRDTARNAWWATTAGTTAKVQSLLAKHPRLWLVESDPQKDLKDCAAGIPLRIWDFGPNLRIALLDPGSP